jgi:hypothetical protein
VDDLRGVQLSSGWESWTRFEPCAWRRSRIFSACLRKSGGCGSPTDSAMPVRGNWSARIPPIGANRRFQPTRSSENRAANFESSHSPAQAGSDSAPRVVVPSTPNTDVRPNSAIGIPPLQLTAWCADAPLPTVSNRRIIGIPSRICVRSRSAPPWFAGPAARRGGSQLHGKTPPVRVERRSTEAAARGRGSESRARRSSG